MKTNKLAVLALIACSLSAETRAGDTDVSRVNVIKIHDLNQTSTANPVDGATPYAFGIQVFDSSSTLALITSASYTPPGGSSTSLSGDGFGDFEFEQLFTSQAAMDAVFANDTYAFAIQTANVPTAYNPSITLSGDNYPGVPKLSNTDWSGGKLVFDSSVDYTFNWNGFGNFFIALGTEDNKVFEGAFSNGSTVSGGMLLPNQEYLAAIQFGTGTSSVDGPTTLFGGYSTVTHFTIHTVPEPSAAVLLLFGAAFGCRGRWRRTNDANA